MCKNLIACNITKFLNKPKDIKEWFIQKSEYLFFGLSLMTMGLGFFLMLNNKFRKHPYKLVAATLLVEAGLFQAFAEQALWCKFDLSKVLQFWLLRPKSGYYS